MSKFTFYSLRLTIPFAHETEIYYYFEPKSHKLFVMGEEISHKGKKEHFHLLFAHRGVMKTVRNHIKAFLNGLGYEKPDNSVYQLKTVPDTNLKEAYRYTVKCNNIRESNYTECQDIFLFNMWLQAVEFAKNYPWEFPQAFTELIEEIKANYKFSTTDEELYTQIYDAFEKSKKRPLVSQVERYYIHIKCNADREFKAKFIRRQVQKIEGIF